MRRISRVIQTVRDAILVVLSIVLISTDIGPDKELANYFLAGICAVILGLTVTNLALNAFRVKRKGYFLGNSVFQLVLAFLFLGLFAPLGIILLCFNVAVLASLWEKKSPEEQLLHPRKPLTRQQRVLVGVGVLVMFVSLFVSWLSTFNLPLMGVYTRSVDLSAAGSAFSGSAVTVIFGVLGLGGSPVAILLGLLGLLRRRLALAAGILALVIAVGWAIWTLTVGVMPGIGPFVMAVGGALVLSSQVIQNKS